MVSNLQYILLVDKLNICSENVFTWMSQDFFDHNSVFGLSSGSVLSDTKPFSESSFTTLVLWWLLSGCHMFLTWLWWTGAQGSHLKCFDISLYPVFEIIIRQTNFDKGMSDIENIVVAVSVGGIASLAGTRVISERGSSKFDFKSTIG